MPNWCINTLTVSGDVSEIKKFKEGVKSEEAHSDLSFDKLVPMPEELREMPPDFMDHCGNAKAKLKSVENPKDGGDFIIASGDTSLEATEEAKRISDEKRKLKEKYGVSSWYEWSVINWGTKWDAHEVEIVKNNDEELIYKFYTAWCPPYEWLITASEKFSKLKFKVEYFDECVSFEGYATIENGNISDNCKKLDFDEESQETKEAHN